MPFFNAPNTNMQTTAAGSADGYVTVADSTDLYPGAKIWLNDGTDAAEYLIVSVDEGQIGLREVKPPSGGVSYGRSPVTQWASGTGLFQPAQVVYVEREHLKVNRPES